MANELVALNGGKPAALVEVENMDPATKELIRKTVAPDSTDAELALFIYDCLRRGTHPLDRMIHFTKRGGRPVHITGIDYMRSLSADTGELAGCDDAIFEEAPNGGPPLKCTVTVYRLTQGQRYAYTATCHWYEYFPGEGPAGFMWKKMPHVMLAKVTEAVARRKAFPRQLGGLYEKAELDQAQKGEAVEVLAEPPKPVERCQECRNPLLPGESGLCPGCARTKKLLASGGGESLPGAAPAAETTAGPMQSVADVAVAVVSKITPAVAMDATQQRKRAFAIMAENGISNAPAHSPDRRAIYGKALGLGRIATEKEARAFTAEQWGTICDWITKTFQPPIQDQPDRQAVRA